MKEKLEKHFYESEISSILFPTSRKPKRQFVPPNIISQQLFTFDINIPMWEINISHQRSDESANTSALPGEQRWNRSSLFHTGNGTGRVSQTGPDWPVDRYS